MTRALEYDATLSECGEYRYSLTRRWLDSPRRPMVFIGLNPSTADQWHDDPTIRRMLAFADRERAGGIIVVNLYALRATDPHALWKHPDPIGPGNTNAILRAARSGEPVVCCWGVNAGGLRAAAVVDDLGAMGAQLKCLGTTKDGHPRHPLYLKKTQPLETFP